VPRHFPKPRSKVSCIKEFIIYSSNFNKISTMDINMHRYVIIVATLALGSRPRQGLARLQAKRKPGSEGKCEGMNSHTSKGAFTLGVWSPGGLPNLHRAIVGVKTQWIEKLLISLESY
jgi:hypothetical protein